MFSLFQNYFQANLKLGKKILRFQLKLHASRFGLQNDSNSLTILVMKYFHYFLMYHYHISNILFNKHSGPTIQNIPIWYFFFKNAGCMQRGITYISNIVHEVLITYDSLFLRVIREYNVTKNSLYTCEFVSCAFDLAMPKTGEYS